MGLAALGIGSALLAFSAPLAHLLREGDEHYRQIPWAQAFEPSDGWLASDTGRWRLFRGWILAGGAGFLCVGTGLLLRAL